MLCAIKTHKVFLINTMSVNSTVEQHISTNPAVIANRLKQAGMRPTRQRIMLCQLLWLHPQPRHVTAEKLHAESKEKGMKISLATVYNTLHQLTEIGLLSKVVIESGKTHFDTNTGEHQHIVNEVTGEIMDLPQDSCILSAVNLPEGMALSTVDVVVRVRPEA